MSASGWIHRRESERSHPGDGGVSDRQRVEALIRSFRYEMPQGDLPSPEEVAPIIREAGSVQSARGLDALDRAARGGHATGVLRPAAARQAFADLGLVSWMREWLRIDYAEMPFPGPARGDGDTPRHAGAVAGLAQCS